MLPELGTQPARAAACTGMVAEGQAEGRSGVALPDALERKYPRAGHSGRGSGFCAAHAFDRSTERCRAVAITCMTRPFSAPSNVP